MQIELANFENFSQLVVEAYDVLLPLVWDGVKDNKLVRVVVSDFHFKDGQGVTGTLRWRTQPTQEELDVVSRAFSINMPDYDYSPELIPHTGIMLPTSYFTLTKKENVQETTKTPL